MTVVDGDMLRMTCNFELGDGTQYQNVYHYIRDGTDPQSDASHVTALQSACNAMYATIDDLVKDDVVEQLSYVDRVAWVGDPIYEWRVAENIGTFTPTFVPTQVTDALPFQSSPYLIFKTERPRSVGKKFLFPFVETTQAGTILTAPTITALVAYGVQALTVHPVGGDVTLAPCIPRTGVETILRLLVAVTNDVLGSQKRRRPGVGA